jgi:endonuclease/exonuclease/phosphatase family metal-dependent hydrolase
MSRFYTNLDELTEKHMRYLVLNVVAIALTFIMLLSCGKIGNEPAVPIDLRIMSFNIEWGGTNISFDNVVEAIRVGRADIVGIQEADGNLQRLAVALGWYYDLSNHVISRYPLIDPLGAEGRYVYVEVEPGRIVVIANVHLPSYPYGPEAIRDGATTDDVLAIERSVRLPKIQPYLEVLTPLVESGIPVFITGDFNAPAHTDWVEAMVGSRPFLTRAVDWPVSRAVTAAGFKDSWRVIYPDPVRNPGLTWWAGRPPLDLYTPGENDAHDRIDFVWYEGPATVQSSEIVGEANQADVSISVMPWPSDHRAVVSQFKVMSAPMPPLISMAHRVYRIGENVEVYAHGPADTQVIISLIRVDDAQQVLVRQPLDSGGHLLFPDHLFTPGEYKVEMGSAGNGALSSRGFWVLGAQATPAVDVIGLLFNQNDPIEIRWHNSPANRNDYVMVYRSEASAGNEADGPWAYTNAGPEGHLSLNRTTSEYGWPLEPGSYVIRLMNDDSNEQLAESKVFTIQ